MLLVLLLTRLTNSQSSCSLRTVAGATVLIECAIRARLLHAHLLLAALARRAVLARVDHAADADLQKGKKRRSG